MEGFHYQPELIERGEEEALIAHVQLVRRDQSGNTVSCVLMRYATRSRFAP